MIENINKLFAKKIFNLNYNDDYIKRLRSLVIGEGMLQEKNIELIDYAIKNLNSNSSIVEIGIYGGLSTNLILYLLQKHQKNNLLFNCDPWIYEGYNDTTEQSKYIDGSVEITRSNYSDYLYKAYINSIEFLHNKKRPHTFKLTSDDFFNKWSNNQFNNDVWNIKTKLGGEIAFAYIDGNHSYEQCKKDFENVNNYLVKGGYILFDDSAQNLKFGSAIFMQHFENNKNYTVVDNEQNWLIKKVN